MTVKGLYSFSVDQELHQLDLRKVDRYGIDDGVDGQHLTVAPAGKPLGETFPQVHNSPVTIDGDPIQRRRRGKRGIEIPHRAVYQLSNHIPDTLRESIAGIYLPPLPFERAPIRGGKEQGNH